MKKTIALILSVIMLSLLLAGCSAQPTDYVGVMLYKYDDTYIASVRQALEDYNAKQEKKEKVISLKLNDAKNDQGTQNDQIDVLLSQNVSALVVNLVNQSAADTILEKAKEKEVPVVLFNREPGSDIMKKYPDTVYIGTRPEEAGIIQGQMVVDYINNGNTIDKNKDGKISYVMLQGEADHAEAIARTKYSVQTITEAGYQVEELGLQIADWDTDKAKTAVDAWLSSFGENIELILCNNDNMASGAVAALQSAGYNKGDKEKYIPVYGIDATDDAKKLISDGFMTGTVNQDAAAMAKAIYDITMNIMDEKAPLEGLEYSFDETGYAVRIPYTPFVG